jgi:ring-1,2-phenylacetyl-CoA epoxidase subunit PaaE
LKPTFYPLQVKKITRQTRNAVAIELDIPASLQSIFAYQPGQYLTIRKKIEGEETRRTYSLCSSPLDNKWTIAVKKVPGGLFSTWANEQLQEGDTLDIMPPNGKFSPSLNDENKKHYAAFAAGSGITPVISIIATTLATEPNSSFTLVYGNQSRSSIIFKEALEALKNKYINRLSIYHILSREKTDADINYGRIDAAKCEQIFAKLLDINSVDEFFLCGPQEMSACVHYALVQRGIDSTKIRQELFTVTQKTGKRKEQQITATQDSPKSRITVRIDGMETSFDLAYDSDPIMDAALHEGMELPYACKGGMCCTCKAKLVEGEVEMEVHYGLEHDEIAAGFILTCQSHPKTPVVVVDFDQR